MVLVILIHCNMEKPFYLSIDGIAVARLKVPLLLTTYRDLSAT